MHLTEFVISKITKLGICWLRLEDHFEHSMRPESLNNKKRIYFCLHEQIAYIEKFCFILKRFIRLLHYFQLFDFGDIDITDFVFRYQTLNMNGRATSRWYCYDISSNGIFVNARIPGVLFCFLDVMAHFVFHKQFQFIIQLLIICN